jgi:tetratricopeptide (TPR) repeat protein
MAAADQKQSMAAAMIFKVLVYYGTLVEKAANKLDLPADYPEVNRTIHSAVKLDPYNMDGYYFAQAILVWDVGKVDIANELLKYGMKYRTWDYQLPFFSGFNYAYFLKDYPNAAKYYRRAADITGNELFANLAGRYLQESGKTDMAVEYLAAMEKGARNEAIKKSFTLRLEAFRVVQRLEKSRDAFVKEYGRFPDSVKELVVKRYIGAVPVDPYGGEFYLDANGSVRTTSKYALGRK